MPTASEIHDILASEDFFEGHSQHFGPAYIQRAGESGGAFVQLGMGIGGPLDIKQGMAYGATTLGWVIDPTQGLTGTWHGTPWEFPEPIAPGDIIEIIKDMSAGEVGWWQREPKRILIIKQNGKEVQRVHPS